MTRVKVCGLKRVADARAAVAAGAGFIGLVFAPSRRRIDVSTACEIAAAVHEAGTAEVVGVFVDEQPAVMNRLARECGLDYVQLSGSEPDGIMAALDVPAIQVVHVGAATGDSLAERLARCPAPLLLLDTAHTGSAGGTGRTFDWSLVPQLERPVLLAGGLNPENVSTALHAVRPWGVDVSSGVERNGEKDAELIGAFIAAVRACDPIGMGREGTR